jgi:hypothetical protein
VLSAELGAALRVALLPAGLKRDSATRPRVFPSFPLHLNQLSLLRGDCAHTCVWSGGEGRGASSALGSDEAATTAWTKRRARPWRVHTESIGALAGAKAARGKAARAGAGRSWPPLLKYHQKDVESGSADRGVPGGSEDESAKLNTGVEEGVGGGGGQGRGGEGGVGVRGRGGRGHGRGGGRGRVGDGGR